MKAPQTTYTLHQHMLDRSALTHEWVILNSDGEAVATFAMNADDEAHDVWWSWLTAEERAEWEEYWDDLEAYWDVQNEQQSERRLLACDR